MAPSIRSAIMLRLYAVRRRGARNSRGVGREEGRDRSYADSRQSDRDRSRERKESSRREFYELPCGKGWGGKTLRCCFSVVWSVLIGREKDPSSLHWASSCSIVTSYPKFVVNILSLSFERQARWRNISRFSIFVYTEDKIYSALLRESLFPLSSQKLKYMTKIL